MKGRAEAIKREGHDLVTLAYLTAYFTREPKPKKLTEYLRENKRASTPDQIFAALLAHQSRGAEMRVTRLN